MEEPHSKKSPTSSRYDFRIYGTNHKNRETVMELCKVEVESKTNVRKLSLIMYVVGVNPTIVVVERYITTNWNYIEKLKVYYHNDG